MATIFKPGDRVAYSRTFLRDTGQIFRHTADMRGEVLNVEAFGDKQAVTVLWDGHPGNPWVLNTNLVLESRIHLEPA